MILFLTLYRTVKVSKVAGRLPILKKLQNDGIWYYLVITATNLISVVFTIRKFLLLTFHPPGQAQRLCLISNPPSFEADIVFSHDCS